MVLCQVGLGHTRRYPANEGERIQGMEVVEGGNGGVVQHQLCSEGILCEIVVFFFGFPWDLEITDCECTASMGDGAR